LYKLRISSRKLKIEVGRFSKIPCDERRCNNYISGGGEDAIHFYWYTKDMNLIDTSYLIFKQHY